MPKPQLTKDIMHHYEKSARSLRAKAGVKPCEPFDPLTSLAELGVMLKYPDELTNLPKELLIEMNSLDAKEWSGMGNELPTGKLLVVLNRHQTPERARVTLLEEVAHHFHGHTPVSIGPGGRAQYYPQEEQESKFTAAAALLPSKEIAKAVYRGESATYIASKYGASVELVEMRIKTLNLWDYYQQGDDMAAAA